MWDSRKTSSEGSTARHRSGRLVSHRVGAGTRDACTGQRGERDSDPLPLRQGVNAGISNENDGQGRQECDDSTADCGVDSFSVRTHMHLHKGKYLDNRTYSSLPQKKTPPIALSARGAGCLRVTVYYMIFRLFHSLFEVVNVSIPDCDFSPVALVNQDDPRSDDGPTNNHRASPDC